MSFSRLKGYVTVRDGCIDRVDRFERCDLSGNKVSLVKKKRRGKLSNRIEAREERQFTFISTRYISRIFRNKIYKKDVFQITLYLL